MVAPAFNLTVLIGRGAVSQSGNFGSPGNLTTPQPSEKASIPGNGSHRYDFGAPVLIRQMALLYTDFEAGENVTLQASTGADSSGVVWQQNIALSAQARGRPPGYRHFFMNRPDLVSARYVTVYADSGATRTAGRLMVGAAIQPEFNADYGDTSWGYEEAEDPELLDSGVEVLIERTPAPFMEFGLSWLTETEMNNDWEPLSRFAIEANPVLVCRDPSLADPHNALFYGRLRLAPIVAADFDMYEVSGKIRSMI